ncbi:hypothetical protein CVU75_02610, partial [Candidatus Dependentiae bacterium HGW-Dependentiae-1]
MNKKILVIFTLLISSVAYIGFVTAARGGGHGGGHGGGRGSGMRAGGHGGSIRGGSAGIRGGH